MGIASRFAAVLLTGASIVASAATAELPNELVFSRDSPFLLFDGDIVLSNAGTPPPADAAWQPIKLPDTWRLHKRYLEGVSAWYRFHMPQTAPEEPVSLYLWRFSMNAEAYFNGEPIGSGGSFDEPIARNWNRPLLFNIPRSAWRETNNELYVHLRVYPGFGNLTPPAIGPTRVLAPAYQQRYFLQITLSQLAAVVTLIVAVVSFAFWFTDRRDTTYLCFAAASTLWAVYGLNLFVQNVHMPATVWWWIVHASADGSCLMLMFFAHRLMRVSRPRIEAVAVAATAIGLVLYAWWDLPQLARYNNYVHSIMIIPPAYVTFYAIWRAVRYRDRDAIFLSACFLVLLAMGIHDLVLNSLALPELWATRFFLTQFGSPLMLLLFVIHLARRLTVAVRETRSANVRLEVRVKEVTNALEEGFEARRTLERDQVAAAERERIYQDLHDDVGAKLLSLVYASRDDRQAGLARDALHEIRSIVASDAMEGGELKHVAADWRLEIERRCEQAAYLLDWEEHLDDTRLSGMQRYQLDRVLRELVSNALEHSGGKRIHALVRAENGLLKIVVEDDGHGFLEPEKSTGHGLMGVRRRVAGLNGEVAWARGKAGGARCEVAVPLPPFGG